MSINIPLGVVLNEYCQILTYRSASGNWYKNTYNDHGKMTSHESSRGYKEEYTYNDCNQEISYKDSEGSWYKKVYNDQGNLITFEDATGIYLVIADDGEYFLMVNQTTGLIKAGCREFDNVQEALEHWNRDDDRAVLFTAALKKYFNV